MFLWFLFGAVPAALIVWALVPFASYIMIVGTGIIMGNLAMIARILIPD
jgi:hypothetical protein